MIRPGSSRTAFPTESRRVPGTEDCYKSHILAYCRSCGVEGAILIPNNSGSVPPEAGVKMFRKRLHWKMGSSRNKDVCPACDAPAKLAAAPVDKRAEVMEDLKRQMNLGLALDPEYTKQKEYEALFLDFPMLLATTALVSRDYEAEGRTLPTDTKLRIDALIQGALKRAKRDDLMTDEMIAEIENRVEELQALLVEVENRAAFVIPIMEQVNALDMPAQKPKAPEVTDMTPQTGRPGTALADAFIKAQTDKIKQGAAQRPARTPEEQATLDKLIDDQARDAKRGLRLTGKNRPAPLPPMKLVKPPAEPAPPMTMEQVREVIAEPEPVKKKPNRVKRTGGWDDMTPEQHAARAAKMTRKRNEGLAKKAGLPFDEWERRNEARKAQEAQKRDAKAAKPVPQPTGGRRDVPRYVQDELDAQAMLDAVIRSAGAAGAPLSRGDIAILGRKPHESIDAYSERLAAHSVRYQPTAKAEPAPPAPQPKPVQPETPMTAKPAPQTIHDNTVAPTSAGVLDRLKISEALNEHYVRTTSSGEGGYYLGDFSDKVLGELLGVPQAWVEERREAMLFGPDVNENTSKDAEEIAALMKEVSDLKAAQDRLFDEGAAEVSKIEARQAALLERIREDTKKMLDDASGKVADEVARIETRVSEVDRRIAALAERR